jgi:hypothetical protein
MQFILMHCVTGDACGNRAANKQRSHQAVQNSCLGTLSNIALLNVVRTIESMAQVSERS